MGIVEILTKNMKIWFHIFLIQKDIIGTDGGSNPLKAFTFIQNFQVLRTILSIHNAIFTISNDIHPISQINWICLPIYIFPAFLIDIL